MKLLIYQARQFEAKLPDDLNRPHRMRASHMHVPRRRSARAFLQNPISGIWWSDGRVVAVTAFEPTGHPETRWSDIVVRHRPAVEDTGPCWERCSYGTAADAIAAPGPDGHTDGTLLLEHVQDTPAGERFSVS